jgi:hypothetical protein
MNIKLEKAVIINRPSKNIKSPYLADILINNKIELAHSPSLGLSGLITNNVKEFSKVPKLKLDNWIS